jgi:hypothetical protein
MVLEVASTARPEENLWQERTQQRWYLRKSLAAESAVIGSLHLALPIKRSGVDVRQFGAGV